MTPPPRAYDLIDRWLDRMIDEKRLSEAPDRTPPLRRLDLRNLANEIDDAYAFTSEEQSAFEAILDGYTFHECRCDNAPHYDLEHDGWSPREMQAVDTLRDKIFANTEAGPR